MKSTTNGKCGIRGTATGRMNFTDMYVPKRKYWLGWQGLRVALTVLDFGRTTFGARSRTGAAKFCVERMVHRANHRLMQDAGDFHGRSKIAERAAETHSPWKGAMIQTTALIDSGAEDDMVEMQMIKVFASDQLWRITNDCLQIGAGAGFFTDQPFERQTPTRRDARLNQIGEGKATCASLFHRSRRIAPFGQRPATNGQPPMSNIG